MSVWAVCVALALRLVSGEEGLGKERKKKRHGSDCWFENKHQELRESRKLVTTLGAAATMAKTKRLRAFMPTSLLS